MSYDPSVNNQTVEDDVEPRCYPFDYDEDAEDDDDDLFIDEESDDYWDNQDDEDDEEDDDDPDVIFGP